MKLLETLLAASLDGVPATVDQALALDASGVGIDELCDAADAVRRRHCGDVMDTCSIINARSGRCPEDCHWCSQARRHHTGIDEYDIVGRERLLRCARLNTEAGVQRFSLVTSGRRVTSHDVGAFCDLYKAVRSETPIYLCASMGLIGLDEMQALYDAGVRRYHCNLETSPSHFVRLCSTHTYDDKLRTIGYARQVGMDVCSGGIIGMGETMRDRLELVEQARLAGACSVPVNLLNPIKGTPLEDTPLLDEEEIIRSVALMRFVAPTLTMRFAGGRARLSQQATERILRGGMNGVMIGDLLTTVGNSVAEDYAMFERIGYSVSPNPSGDTEVAQ